jgi:hypothetical protein
MNQCVSGLAVSVVLAATLGMTSEQPDQPKSLTASVSVTTSDSRSNIAVLSKSDPQFLFCIDLAKPLSQEISYTGTARVVFRPLPPLPVPAGVKIEGPEDVNSALAVLPAGGKGWLFLGSGEETVLPAGDPAVTGVATVPVRIVRRVDWVAASGGPRRGMDVETCFLEGGGAL